MTQHQLLRIILVTFSLASALGCARQRDPGAEAGDATDRPHTEAGGACVYDTDCDDGLFCNGLERCVGSVCIVGIPPCMDTFDCTVDDCDEDMNQCAFVPDDSVCSNGDACDGDELCIPGYGCLPGTRPACNDDDPCTMDSCDSAGGCMHTPRDIDRDGYVDAFCGGNDCNDLRADMNPGMIEICDDRIDNNCDRARDFADTMCFPTNDSCAMPTVLPGPGTYSGGTRGTRLDYPFPCAPWGLSYDVVFEIAVPALHDVHATITGAGGFSRALMLQSVCGESASTIRCDADGDLYRRSVDPGTYYLIVGSDTPGEFDLTIEFLPPTPPPPNDDCTTPIDVSAGGTFTGSFVDTGDDYIASCDFGGMVDVVYALTLTAPSDVTVSATSSGFATMFVSLSTRCGDPSSELRCGSGNPGSVAQRAMAPGTYYVLLESDTESTYSMTVTITPPGSALPGDLCAGPIDVPGSGTYMGSLTGMWDDYQSSCDWGSLYSDVVYRVVTTDVRDLQATVTTPGFSNFFLAIRSGTCDTGPDVRCTWGSGSGDVRARGIPAGEHFVFIDGPPGMTYRLDLLLSSSTPTVGDLCTAPIDLPGPGSYSGTIAGMWDDYETSCDWGASGSVDVVYHLRTSAAQDVRLSLNAAGLADSFLAVRSSCATGPDLRCVAGRGMSTTTVRGLPPGDHYILVDLAAWASSYTLDVALLPATPTEFPTGSDLCAGAWVIGPSGGYYIGNTSTARNDYTASCAGGAASPDVVFRMDLATRSRVVLNTEGSAYDTALYVRQGTCTGVEVACNDDWLGLQSYLDLTLAAGTYYVFLDGFSTSSSGAYNLDVSITPM